MQVKITVNANSEAGEDNTYTGDITLSADSGEQAFTFTLLNPDTPTQQFIVRQGKKPIIHVRGAIGEMSEQTTRDLEGLADHLLYFVQLVGTGMKNTIGAIYAERQAAEPGAEGQLQEAWAKVIGRKIAVTLTAHDEQVMEIADATQQAHIRLLFQ